MKTTFETVLDFFREICKIPRASHHVDKISNYLAGFAADRGFKYIQDPLKNIIIFKEASSGYEDQPPLMLQGHMDMVAVCDDQTQKDMINEGLDLVEKDGYLFAKNTSLGADDGIALAYAMAILDSDTIAHPDLEVIFTVDEETGMYGAHGIDLSPCRAKKLINIDSDREGVITVSCAGGLRINAELKGCLELVTGMEIALSISGLAGGHSGLEIQKGRANAAHMLADILSQLFEKYELHIIEMKAGDKVNAIPCFADCRLLAVNLKDDGELLRDIEHIEEKIKILYDRSEDSPDISVELNPEKECCCYSVQDSLRFIEYITEVPDGVISMHDETDMVKNSLNLGILKCSEDGLSAEYLIRSSADNEKYMLRDRLSRVSKKYGGNITAFGSYPTWEYKEGSELLSQAVKVYRKLYGSDPLVTGTHLGLECGILAGKINDLEVISIGPNLLDIHTTKERMDLESAARVWEYLVELIGSFIT